MDVNSKYTENLKKILKRKDDREIELLIEIWEKELEDARSLFFRDTKYCENKEMSIKIANEELRERRVGRIKKCNTEERIKNILFCEIKQMIKDVNDLSLSSDDLRVMHKVLKRATEK